jgi:hypothetical protein
MATKQLKLYIPIITPNQKRILIGVHNCTEIRKHVPSNYKIGEHLLIQNMRKAQGLPLLAMSIEVSEKKFIDLQKELSRKVGASYRSNIIDVIVEGNQLPIVQIVMKT